MIRFDDAQTVSQALQFQIDASGILGNTKYASIKYDIQITHSVIKVMSISVYERHVFKGRRYLSTKMAYRFGKVCQPLKRMFAEDGSYTFTCSFPQNVRSHKR
jgi:hypothetical protein